MLQLLVALPRLTSLSVELLRKFQVTRIKQAHGGGGGGETRRGGAAAAKETAPLSTAAAAPLIGWMVQLLPWNKRSKWTAV